MSAEDTLVYESQHRIRQTAIAVGGGVLFMLASVLGLVGPHASVNEATLSLIVQHQRATLAIVAALVNAIAEVLIAATLIYLWRCTNARTADSASAKARTGFAVPVIPLIVVIGTVVAIVGGVAYAFEISAKASDFVHTGAQTYDEATRITGGALLLILQILSQLGALLIAISFVMVSLTSMRVGLLPRFLGYVGIFAGILVIFPIIVVPIVELYWLAAVAILYSGNWPSGLPAAWRTGKAEPWPPAAEVRARRMAEAQEARERKQSRRDRVSDASPATTSQSSDTDAGGASDPPNAGTSARKRKRKRRH